MSEITKDPEAEKAFRNIVECIRLIRLKHPDAERPSADGEPPYHKMMDDYMPEPNVVGSMDCHVCKKKKALRYSISSYNGHIHAQCSTNDCVRFMQ